MATVNTTSTLDGIFKEIYAAALENLIPENSPFQRMAGFSQADKVGDGFHQPVVLTQEGGITHAAAGDGAFTLSSAIAMTTKDAIVDGYQTAIRSQNHCSITIITGIQPDLSMYGKKRKVY